MANQELSDQDAKKLLDQIVQTTEARVEGVPSKEELCQRYKQVKPFILQLLPWIEKLPNGKRIADVIRFLMSIADSVCG
jgi:hypothetical protein